VLQWEGKNLKTTASRPGLRPDWNTPFLKRVAGNKDMIVSEENTMTTEPMTLDRLSIGQRATIVRVGGEKSTRRRLLDMGMISGETVTIKAVAPLGDPLELIIKGYHLSLRRHEARDILVEVQV
jgi:ferrous iron transport protein A